MPRQIYAVYDNVAEEIVGGLHLHPHQAPAIRMFSDVAKLPNSQIGLHPADFDLLLLGTLLDDNTIESAKKNIPIITGAAWLAAQQPSPREDGDPNAS